MADKLFSLSSRYLVNDRATNAHCAKYADRQNFRSAADYYYTGNSPTVQLNAAQSEFCRRVYPNGRVRTGYKDNFVHGVQKSAAQSLPKADWPRDSRGRSAWPSSPNFNEILEMSRRGVTTAEPKSLGGFIPVSFSEFNCFSELIIRTVSRSVIGIRADVKVPAKWLGLFRYRWNFLILTAPRLPIGLARFLVGKWLTDPYSLWLERRESLKSYLRKVPESIFNRSVEALQRRVVDPDECWSGSSLSTDSETSEYDSDESEISDW